MPAFLFAISIIYRTVCKQLHTQNKSPLALDGREGFYLIIR